MTDEAPLTDEAFDAALLRTASRFARAATAPWERHFAREKLRRDPVTRALAALGPLGDVLDVGTGRGQLAIFLLELGHATSVRGVDWDVAKVALATRAAHAGHDGQADEALAAHFAVGDVASFEASGPFDTVLLVDVLHYLSAADQDTLLERAAGLVRPGGRLVVRDASKGYGVRSALTAFVERCSRAVRLNRGTHTTLRDVARELVPILERAGLRCALMPCWRGTPTANVLLVGERALAEPAFSDPAA